MVITEIKFPKRRAAAWSPTQRCAWRPLLRVSSRGGCQPFLKLGLCQQPAASMLHTNTPALALPRPPAPAARTGTAAPTADGPRGTKGARSRPPAEGTANRAEAPEHLEAYGARGTPRRASPRPRHPQSRGSRRHSHQPPQKRNGRRQAAAPLRRRLASHPGLTAGAVQQDTRLAATAAAPIRIRTRSRPATLWASQTRALPFCGPRPGWHVARRACCRSSAPPPAPGACAPRPVAAEPGQPAQRRGGGGGRRQSTRLMNGTVLPGPSF